MCHCNGSFRNKTLQDQRAELYVTRQIFSAPSSEISSDPSPRTRTSTGRPQTLWLCSSGIQPTTKSSYPPVGCPLLNGIRTILYPVLRDRFHEPCIATNALPRYSCGNIDP